MRSRSSSRTTGRASTFRPRRRLLGMDFEACGPEPSPSGRNFDWNRALRAVRGSFCVSPSARLPAAPHGDAVAGEETRTEDGRAEAMSERESIRVALVEDKRLTREGLGALLDAASDTTCVGLYASVEQALAGLEASPCDVLLLDIHLPGM